MKVSVVFQGKTSIVELSEKSSVADALVKAGVSVQSVIPRKNGTVITDADLVKDGDTIDALRIVSGG